MNSEFTRQPSGVLGNGHAPFWNSGRRSDPPLDCDTLSDWGIRPIFLKHVSEIEKNHLEH
jgi:hypothetical protein